MVDQEGEVIDENSYKDTKITMVGGLGFLTGIIILDNCTNDAYFAHCRTNMKIKNEKCIGPKVLFKSWVGPGSAHFT